MDNEIRTYWFISFMHKNGNGNSAISCDSIIFNQKQFTKDISDAHKAENVCIINFFKLSKEEFEIFNSQ